MDKALESVTSARDYSIVLLSGGAMYLGDGVFDVLHNVEPSAAALGTAAVGLGIAKAVDAIRGRRRRWEGPDSEGESKSDSLLRRSNKLLDYFETSDDVANAREMRRTLALYEAELIDIDVVADMYTNLSTGVLSQSSLGGRNHPR